MPLLSLMHLICCLLRHSSELKVVSLKTIENCTIKVVYLLAGCVWGEGKEGEKTVALRLQCCLATSAARNRNGSRSASGEKAPGFKDSWPVQLSSVIDSLQTTALFPWTTSLFRSPIATLSSRAVSKLQHQQRDCISLLQCSPKCTSKYVQKGRPGLLCVFSLVQ